MGLLWAVDPHSDPQEAQMTGKNRIFYLLIIAFINVLIFREWDREQPPWNDRGRGGRGRGDRGGRGFDRRNDRGGFGGFNDRNNDRGGFGDRGGGFGNNGGFGDRDRDRDNRDRRDRSRERDRSRDRDSRPAKRERRSRWGSQAESGEPESAGHSQEVQDLINAQEQQFEMQQQKPEDDQPQPVADTPVASVPDNTIGSEATQEVIPESNEAPVQEHIPVDEPVHQEPELMAQPMSEQQQQPEYHEPVQESAQPEYREPVQEPVQPEYHEPAQQEYEAPPVHEPAQPEYHEPVQEPVQPEYEAQPVQEPENSHSAAFEQPLEEANHRQEHLPEPVPEQQPEFLVAKPAVVDLPPTFANNGNYVDENNALANTEEPPQEIAVENKSTTAESSSEVNIETEASINE